MRHERWLLAEAQTVAPTHREMRLHIWLRCRQSWLYDPIRGSWQRREPIRGWTLICRSGIALIFNQREFCKKQRFNQTEEGSWMRELGRVCEKGRYYKKEKEHKHNVNLVTRIAMQYDLVNVEFDITSSSFVENVSQVDIVTCPVSYPDWHKESCWRVLNVFSLNSLCSLEFCRTRGQDSCSCRLGTCALQRVASCVSKYGALTAVLQAVYVCSVGIIK